MSRGKRVVLSLAIALGALSLGTASAWLAWEHEHPCWRYSNAAWCGHFCDDDPCACPDRHAASDPYGGGTGCPDP